MARNGKPHMFDTNLLLQAGLGANGLPIKQGVDASALKNELFKTMSILDEQNAVNRYQWYNLPCSISSQELERLLYFKGQLCFFYIPELDEFYFMPYALSGTIDFYGRYNIIHPVPISSGGSTEEKKLVESQAAYLSTVRLKVLYDIPTNIDFDVFNTKIDGVSGYCVLLHDYTKQLAETIIPRSALQKPVLNVMSEMLPLCRTALFTGTGVEGLRVGNPTEAANAEIASESFEDAALTGRRYIAIEGSLEFQELANGTIAKAEEYLMALQSIDNLRLSYYGLDNGGLFQKKSHMLESEHDMNAGNVKSILQDGLAIRQRFCDIVNAIWGLGIYCEISDSAIGMDSDFNGDTADEIDQTGSAQGEQEPMINMEGE